MVTVGEGIEEDSPFEGELRHAQDRLWRHPAERGAEQAAANLAARRVYGRRWPSMLMSFIAGCTLVGLVWLLNEEPRAQITESVSQEVTPTTQNLPEGALSLDEWANDVSDIFNRNSVVGLHLGGEPRHAMAQAILLADDGYLITSAHSLIGADDITAVLPGDRSTIARIIASDVVSGIAVLKINTPDLPPPTFADDSQVLVGENVVALAHHGVSTDSLARTVSVLGNDQVTPLPNDDLLSGLFRLSDDLDSEWSGSAILEENGGIVAMAVEGRKGNHYAIPISLARDIAQELISSGSIDHKAWLGVEMSPFLSDGIKAERDLLGGVLIKRVWDETPAARAGLVAGDIIISAGPVNVIDRTDLRELLATVGPDDSVEFRFSRGTTPLVGPDGTTPAPGEIRSEILTTTVVLGARPA
ncbi:MAG: S1-C subfamily serine protease [Verrucomicrobiales bacterium]|jgi:S1-C subfamily serine protease